MNAVRDALSEYLKANGSYPGDPTTYYWAHEMCAQSLGIPPLDLRPFLSSICSMKDPEGKGYAYAKHPDGRYSLGAAFETVAKKGTSFSYGASIQKDGYYNGGVEILNPATYCLSPSENFTAIAQKWLDNGNGICLSAGNFYLTDGTNSFAGSRMKRFDGLTLDGMAVSRNNVSIRGAGDGVTNIYYNGCQVALVLKGTLRNLDIGNLSIYGDTTSYYVDKGAYSQCNQQMGIADRDPNITNARIHDISVRNLRMGISLIGACGSKWPRSPTCYCTGSSCNANNTIENNRVLDIFGTAYEYAPGLWTDQSTGTGIGVQMQQNMTIRNNVVSNASRHNIYVSGGDNESSYLVDNNTISGNRFTGFDETTPYRGYNGTALVIARTPNVMARGNSFNSNRGFGLSVEYGYVQDAQGNYFYIPADNIRVEGNVFRNSAKDIWINVTDASENPQGSVTLSGNTNPQTGSVSCVSGTYITGSCGEPNILFAALSFGNLANALTALESALSSLMGILGR